VPNPAAVTLCGHVDRHVLAGQTDRAGRVRPCC
jgi:hypothetical protein